MIKKEFNKVKNNKLLLLTVIVVCFIPILYAAVFLKSIWDPYGKTGNLPVAVVNQDKAIDYNGKTLDVGDQLVEKLKKNDLLDWQFVTKEEAKKGLKAKEYYMVITLPEDFSKNASTVMDETPKKMEITYETNGSLNYLGEVIGEQAVTQLKAQVAESVTSEYANTIISLIDTVGDGMTQAADGSSKLDDGAGKLADGNKEITTNLDKLANSSVTFSDGVKTLNVGLGTYVDGVNQVNDGAVKLNNGVGQLAGKIPALASGISQLSDGSSTLANGIDQYTNGVGTLNAGASQLVAQNETLNTSASSLSNAVAGATVGPTGLSNGTTGLVAGLSTMSAKLPSETDLAGVPTLTGGLTNLNTQIANLNTAIQAQGDTTTISASLASIATDAQNVATTIETTKAQLGTKSIASSASSELAAVQNTTAFQSLDAAGQQEITNAMNQNTQAATTIDNTAEVATLDQLATQVKSISTTAQAMSINLSGTTRITLKESSQGVTNAANLLLPQAAGTITAQTKGLSDTKQALDTQIIPGAQQINGGITQFNNVYQTNATKFNAGLGQYTAGVSQLNAGSKALINNSAQLNSGAQQLTNGLGTINGSVPMLMGGITTLSEGTQTLAGGTSKLAENSPTLLSGVGKLADGAMQISDGSGKLAEGSGTLGAGITTLKDGTSELSEKLGEASEKVSKLDLTDKTADMIATPDKVKHEKYSDVPNYGHALSPYFLSVSLFVGCLVFNFVYPIRKIADKEGSARSWFISKVTVGGIVATGMALVAGIVMLFLGLEVAHPFEFFIILLFTAYASMFLIMLLAMAFDNPGRFIAMMLLVVQLGASGGTFPVPLTGGFYTALHPFMPMTYSIYGLRQAISSGLGTVTFIQCFGVLFGIVLVVLIALAFTMSVLKKKHQAGISQLHGNQTLLNEEYNYQSKYSLW